MNFLHLIDVLVGNYLGIFVLMLLESSSLPVPSEVVLPLAGVLVKTGILRFPFVILSATLGTIVGSLIDYIIGAKLGLPFLKKYGKYILIRDKHLELLAVWFSKYGYIAVLLLRFVPGFRTLVSFPAGLARMRIGSFLMYSTIGNLLWDMFLTYIGIIFYQNYAAITNYLSTKLDLVAIITAIIMVAYITFYIIKKHI
ncbi:DedA family protein [Sulfolobales archaeon HS-7]|nr:DedA family protein [Sulfolobales archaeon HS-7]